MLPLKQLVTWIIERYTKLLQGKYEGKTKMKLEMNI